jgi:hypothetical protein
LVPEEPCNEKSTEGGAGSRVTSPVPSTAASKLAFSGFCDVLTKSIVWPPIWTVRETSAPFSPTPPDSQLGREIKTVGLLSIVKVPLNWVDPLMGWLKVPEKS